MAECKVPGIEELKKVDGYLYLYENEITRRYSCFKKLWDDIENNEEGGVDKFTRSYERFGVHPRPDGSVYCLEWCPGAQALYLRATSTTGVVKSIRTRDWITASGN